MVLRGRGKGGGDKRTWRERERGARRRVIMEGGSRIRKEGGREKNERNRNG